MTVNSETSLRWYDRLGVKPEKAIKAFLEHGGDINTPDVYGNTILHHVIQYVPGIALPKFLIQQGADVNVKDSDTWTPLHMAVNALSYEKTKLLLDNGADITAKVKDEENPLHIAAWYNNARIVHLLVARGANLYEESGEHGTPLQTALYFRQYKTARALETCIYRQKIANIHRLEQRFTETCKKVSSQKYEKPHPILSRER